MLDSIIEAKRMRVLEQKVQMPIERLQMKLENYDFDDVPSFNKSLKKGNDLAIIGEIKKASPSKGIIRDDFNPAHLAAIYAKAEVSAISVLTEQDFFLGDDAHIEIVRRHCKLPILRKDFIIDPWQVYQSKLIGASAVLLIVAITGKNDLKKLYQEAKSIGLDCLVEVHNRQEIETALEIGTSIIGINNRDLKNFTVDIKTTEHLLKFIPEGVLTVSESGIDKTNVRAVKDLGINAILVGEAFMRSDDVFKSVMELRGNYA